MPPEVLYKKGVLTNFAKFIVKHLGQSFFLNKVAGLRPATLLKKILWHRCFSVDFVKITFTTSHLRAIASETTAFCRSVFITLSIIFDREISCDNGFGWKLPKIAIYLFSQKTPSNVFDRLLIHLFTCFINC